MKIDNIVYNNNINNNNYNKNTNNNVIIIIFIIIIILMYLLTESEVFSEKPLTKAIPNRIYVLFII